MIPVTTFAGKKVAVFGLGGSGLASASALLGRRRRRRRLRRRCGRAWRKRTRPAFPTADLRNADWTQDRGAGARARRAAHASGAALDRRRLRSKAGVEVIGDIELFCRERRAPRAGRAVRRHHRHQRQIDDDGADRPSRRVGRHGRAARRQYRHRDPVAGAAARSRTACPRHRVLVLSDRSGALARSFGRHPDQSQRRSSRSPRHDGALRGGEGTPGRRRAEATAPRSSASTTNGARPIADRLDAVRQARGARFRCGGN